MSVQGSSLSKRLVAVLTEVPDRLLALQACAADRIMAAEILKSCEGGFAVGARERTDVCVAVDVVLKPLVVIKSTIAEIALVLAVVLLNMFISYVESQGLFALEVCGSALLTSQDLVKVNEVDVVVQPALVREMFWAVSIRTKKGRLLVTLVHVVLAVFLGRESCFPSAYLRSTDVFAETFLCR